MGCVPCILYACEQALIGFESPRLGAVPVHHDVAAFRFRCARAVLSLNRVAASRSRRRWRRGAQAISLDAAAHSLRFSVFLVLCDTCFIRNFNSAVMLKRMQVLATALVRGLLLVDRIHIHYLEAWAC